MTTYSLIVHAKGERRVLRNGLTEAEARRLQEKLAWDLRTALLRVTIEEEN